MDDQTSLPSNEIPSVAEPAEDKITFKRSHLYMALLPLAFVVGLSVGYLFWGRQSPPQRAAAPQATPQAAAQEERPQAVKRYDVPVDVTRSTFSGTSIASIWRRISGTVLGA